jgi:GntR family transcriptional regulator/MocR family aminotransferase
MEQSTMPRRPVPTPPFVIPLVQDTGRTLRWRIHQGFKNAILTGQLEAGAHLPSTRTLADSLGVSRSTVVEAFDQLAAEGFLDRRAGSGTYVSQQVATLRATERVGSAHSTRQPAQRAKAGTRLNSVQPRPFSPCEPDAALFPHRLWARLLARRARMPATVPDPAGLPQLRKALAAHLVLSRGVTAAPEQIIVVSGARQALHLCAHTLLDPGDEVWCEDPGYLEARAAVAFAGARPVPVPVDRDGLDVDLAASLAPHARAAYVTPSHQFPTGSVMGLGRRLRLLDWAARKGAWIIEDDYDSEFCYDGRPLPALQGLDDHQSVVYVGTLNKIAYHGLGLGYLVAPPAVADAFLAVAETMSTSPPVTAQAAMADFIAEGHLSQHIARTRTTYRERQELLVDELNRALGNQLRLEPASRGMHVLAALNDPPAEDLARRGAIHGLDLRMLSGYTETPVPSEAVVLGFTHLQPEQIRRAVADFAALFSTRDRRRGGSGA